MTDEVPSGIGSKIDMKEECGFINKGTKGSIESVNCKQSISGKYLVIQIIDAAAESILTLCEVKVYGKFESLTRSNIIKCVLNNLYHVKLITATVFPDLALLNLVG